METRICKFNATYYDYEEKKSIPYQCKENALDSGLCILHDENFIKNDPESNKVKVNDRFNQIAIDRVERNEPIVFLGCHLADV